MKKILLSGYFGFDNSGDDAILKAMVEDFKKLNRDIEIRVLSKNPPKTQKTYEVLASDRFNFFNVLGEIKNTDLFISGGGSLLQDITSTRSLLYYLFLIFTAKFFDKKVYVYANGIGPIDRAFNRFLTKKALEGAGFITLRDQNSYNFVKKLGLKNKNIKVTADPVFTLESISEDETLKIFADEGIEINNKTIGICVREWKNAPDLKEKLARVCDALVLMGYDVLLVPFHLPKDHIYSMDLINLCHNRDHIKMVTKTYSARQLMGIFKKLKLILAMRLHSIIYAAVSNLPIVGLIYDPKVTAMIEQLEIKEYIDVKNFKEEELLEKVKSTLENLEERKKNLYKNTEKMKEKSKENIEIAIKLLDK